MTFKMIRQKTRQKMLLEISEEGRLCFDLLTAIMTSEILDEYLAEKIRSDKVIEGALNDIRGSIDEAAKGNQQIKLEGAIMVNRIRIKDGAIYDIKSLINAEEKVFRGFVFHALATAGTIERLDEAGNVVTEFKEVLTEIQALDQLEDQADQDQGQDQALIIKRAIELLDELLREFPGASVSWIQGRIEEIRDLISRQQGDTDQKIETDFLNQCVKRLPPGTKAREDIISSVKVFADWIKVELSKALKCEVKETPGKLADWMGFKEKTEEN